MQFVSFSQKTGYDISYKLSPKETICMKCHILFSGKNKKNISKCRLLKILPRVLSVKEVTLSRAKNRKHRIVLAFAGAYAGRQIVSGCGSRLHNKLELVTNMSLSNSASFRYGVILVIMRSNDNKDICYNLSRLVSS